MLSYPRSARFTPCFLMLLLAYAPLAKSAGLGVTPAETFRQLSANTWITRNVSLAELGFTTPVVLAATDTRREFYLPVPISVALSEGALQLDANYLRSDGGRTTMVVSLDNIPVSARAFAQDGGDASAAINVDSTPRANGFVRLGVNWTTALAGEKICADSRTPGNILRIEPTSRFSYRYDSRAIHDLAGAWAALPTTVVILVGSDSLPRESYDTAWRLGAVLEQAGKHSVIKVLPAVGDTVDLTNVTVPPALRAIPAFAALAAAGKHQLSDEAEVGAFLSLGQGGLFHADIIVADAHLTANMAAAFDALRDQIGKAAPTAVSAYAEWRARSEPATQTLGASSMRLAPAFGGQSILVSADAGAKAAGLFGGIWRNIGISPALVAQAVEKPPADASVLTLKELGGKPGSFDVLGRAEWTTGFDIAAVSADGRLPTNLQLDVAAAPGAARALPVVSVFLNDVLLGAKQLDANGKSERISAGIPRSALAAKNVLKVAFVRQMSSDDCKETPEAYPVSVLDTSHLQLDKVEPERNFTGMLSRYAADASLLLPNAYLTDAPGSLPRVIRLAVSAGISAANAKLVVVDEGRMAAPLGNFLALDVPFPDGASLVKVAGDRLVLANRGKRTLLDIGGNDHLGILEVARVNGKDGIIYRTVGTNPPALELPLQLSSGNFAAIGTGGSLAELDLDNESGRYAINESNRFTLRKSSWWGVPLLGIVLFVALLIYASRVRRRKAAAKHES